MGKNGVQGPSRSGSVALPPDLLQAPSNPSLKAFFQGSPSEPLYPPPCPATLSACPLGPLPSPISVPPMSTPPGSPTLCPCPTLVPVSPGLCHLCLPLPGSPHAPVLVPPRPLSLLAASCTTPTGTSLWVCYARAPTCALGAVGTATTYRLDEVRGLLGEVCSGPHHANWAWARAHRTP